MSATGTATTNVVDGRITVQVADATDTDIHPGPAGTVLGLATEVEPWGADEQGMERADTALAGMGWRRTSQWFGAEVAWHCTVEAA